MTWKKIKQNENYSINENGEIRNDKTHKILSQTRNSGNGYMCVAKELNVTIGNISQMLKKGTIGQRVKMRGLKFEYAER